MIGGRFLLVGLVCFLFGAGAAMFFGPMLKPATTSALPPCPYAGEAGFSSLPPELVTATGAYEAIRETLGRDSLEGVGAQAEVIARTFAGKDGRISACAKRLAGEQDVESARRAFMRLHRLMQRDASRLRQEQE